MTLAPGRRLGPYEVVAPLGSGGMGEVFKARDTRLERSVAIKILPAAFAADARLRARFEREAKSISQLNHPNICVLHDIGFEEGMAYLVLELVDGETLASRLLRGRLSVPDVIRYGADVADALDRAHRAGIVHRDVKPGNIMITKSGAKLLDFGLAKDTGSAEVLNTQTQQKPLTQEGSIVGTLQYMAPEQLTGDATDARTDIFALGAVLYEMLSGHRAFEGSTRTSLVTAILSGAPRPVSEAQPLAPSALQRVVSKCLEKDPEARWQSAKDVADELRWIGSQSGETSSAKRAHKWPLPIAAAALVVAAMMGARLLMTAPKAQPTNVEMAAPPGWIFAETWDCPFSVSPDGTAVAFSASSGDKRMLWLRRLSEAEAKPLPGTDNGRMPFWSPDGRSIGFFVPGGSLRRLTVGSTPETVCDTRALIPTGGAAWSSNDEIVFSSFSALYLVSAKGGAPRVVPQEPQVHLIRPTFLDGDRFLVTRLRRGRAERSIVAMSLRTGNKQDVVVAGASNPEYVNGRDLAFVADGTLFMQPFDASTLRLKGDRKPVATPIGAQIGIARYSIAKDASVVMYQTQGSRETDLVIVDRNGSETPTKVATANIGDPYVARDGKKATFAQTLEGVADLWQLDMASGIPLRLTLGESNNSAPILSPDSRSIAYTKNLDMYVMPASGGDGKLLVESRYQKFPSDWSPDGRYVVYTEMNPAGEIDINAVDVATGRTMAVVQTPFADTAARFSPDGAWIVYNSMASGTAEVYAQRFPDGGGRQRVSPNGGYMPIWSPDGREVFYIVRDQLMSSQVVRGKEIEFAPPRVMFSLIALSTANPSYGVLPNGKGFLVAKRANAAESRVARVILNPR